MQPEIIEAFEKARKDKFFGTLSVKLRAGEAELIRFEYTKLVPAKKGNQTHDEQFNR